MAVSTSLLRRRAAAALVAVASGLLASGCITGERPTLAEGPLLTGDPAVDAVLARLDGAGATIFTAGYDVLTRFGNLQTPATVAQDGAARRSVTIGRVRFIVDGSSTATCDLDTSSCTTTIDAARVSDTQLTPDFYAASAAATLRRDAAGRTGPPTMTTETVAGQPTTCVSVPLGDGQSTYCALDSGPLARLDAADRVVTMTTYAPSADPTAFTRPG